MLSAAKHLCAHRDRPFASLRVTTDVMLSAAKRLCAHRARPFASLRVTILGNLVGTRLPIQMTPKSIQ